MTKVRVHTCCVGVLSVIQGIDINSRGNRSFVRAYVYIQYMESTVKREVFILIKFTSMVALEIVKITISSGASDEKFRQNDDFSFQCFSVYLVLWGPYFRL